MHLFEIILKEEDLKKFLEKLDLEQIAEDLSIEAFKNRLKDFDLVITEKEITLILERDSSVPFDLRTFLALSDQLQQDVAATLGVAPGTLMELAKTGDTEFAQMVHQLLYILARSKKVG
jgi:hypothetical protein